MDTSVELLLFTGSNLVLKACVPVLSGENKQGYCPLILHLGTFASHGTPKSIINQEWWCMATITQRAQRHENCRFDVILGYMGNPRTDFQVIH